MHLLLIDNYDSFTYNLCDYLLQTGVHCTVLRNDAFTLESLQGLDFQGAVLSPGPKRPADAGLLIPFIEAYHYKIPMLGVCLGHQALGCFFGANLVKAAAPMHGKTSNVLHQGDSIFENIPSPFRAMRYHSLVLESLDNTDLIPLAHSDSGELMALRHKELPLTGLQFHPESILTEQGLVLISNWVRGI
jgi:anthranilate synthase/aminodeoxychorismate synthase-like glutamine amidotransferase